MDRLEEEQMRRNSNLEQSFDEVQLEDNDDIFDRIEAKNSMIVGEQPLCYSAPFTEMDILDQNINRAAAVQLDTNFMDKAVMLPAANS